MQVKIRINDAYIPYYNNKKRVLALYGGSGSGKSYFAAQKIILRTVSEKNHKFLVLRKVANTLKNSVFSLLKDVILDLGIFNEFRINNTDKSFIHLPTGNQIICSGLDEPEKIKSVQGITGMWLEEATEFMFDDFTQLLLRIRGAKDNYVQYILSFNPISEYHWLKSKFIDRVSEKEEWDYLHTTYKDNYFLTDEDKAQIEELKTLHENYYRIYALGEWGIEDKSKKFAYAYDREKHTGEVEWFEEDVTYLSFDFNRDPITCGVIQHDLDGIYVIEAIKLHNSDIYSMCDYIKSKYPYAHFIVTGDATGRNSTALVKDNLNYYKVIKYALELSDQVIRVPTINPPIEHNRVLVNTVLNSMNVLIDPKNASSLHFDLAYVEVTEDLKINKGSRTDERQQADSLDWFRYYLNTFHKSILKRPLYNK